MSVEISLKLYLGKICKNCSKKRMMLDGNFKNFMDWLEYLPFVQVSWKITGKELLLKKSGGRTDEVVSVNEEKLMILNYIQ